KPNLESSSKVKLEMQSNFNKTSVKINGIESIGENKSGVHQIPKEILFSMAAVDPLLPLFATVIEAVKNLSHIYENATHNKQICVTLVERVYIFDKVARYLQSHKEENEEYFRNRLYYDAWVKICHVLEEITEFAKNVSQQSPIQKYLYTPFIRRKYTSIVSKLESACGDLQLTMAIYSVEQREQEYSDIKENI
ncbi:10499_t:CDS:1, partial [Acaulospora morrowiae]